MGQSPSLFRFWLCLAGNHWFTGSLVHLFFRKAGSMGLAAIPTTNLSRSPSYQKAVAETAEEDKRGVCVRLFREDLSPTRLEACYLSQKVHAYRARLILPKSWRLLSRAHEYPITPSCQGVPIYLAVRTNVILLQIGDGHSGRCTDMREELL